ncbi:MAG: M42 family peptidase [Thermoplasmata archaeon]|nr:MAG: M42 family peptidase [Thermoplasmata archaeon]
MEYTARDDLLKLIKKLSDAFGVSGNEGAIREIIKRRIKAHVDSIETDKIGNLICKKNGKDKDSALILAAHMDEIGLMAREVDKHGHIYFSRVGELSKQTLLGQKVHIMGRKKEIHGVITHKKLHIGEEAEGFPEETELYVDTGINMDELGSMGIEIGTYIVPEKKLETLGSNNIISGKALDDRLGCAILIKLAESVKNPNIDIFYVFTAQEEIGMYGAKTSMYKIDASCAIAADISFATDFSDSGIQLGKGPVITIKDSDLIANRKLVDSLVELAKKRHIPYQLEVSDIGTTDALYLSISKGGLPATAVGVPIRNPHSTISIADLTDVKNCMRLLRAFLQHPPLF